MAGEIAMREGEQASHCELDSDLGRAVIATDHQALPGLRTEPHGSGSCVWAF